MPKMVVLGRSERLIRMITFGKGKIRPFWRYSGYDKLVDI